MICKQTTPPCEYPSSMSPEDSPYSNLMPANMRRKTYVYNEIPKEQYFNALPAHCFTTDHWVHEECWVMADDDAIFDFHTKLAYQRNEDYTAVNYSATPQQLAQHEIPGKLGRYNCVTDPGTSAALQHAQTQECFREFVRRCDDLLVPWRIAEKRKWYGKLFTVFFILTGMGILGALVGAVGETLLTFSRQVLGTFEVVLDKTTLDRLAAVIPNDGEESAHHNKAIFVAFVALWIILFFGSAVYALTESMEFVDALYFTTVTATTVGFGDYVPSTTFGKMFTLVYCPFSVVMVAAAINYVASVPLRRHRQKLEHYVLHQFGENVTEADFDDIRQTAGLENTDAIRPNDFVLAMLIRLGRVDTNEIIKCWRVFSKLDTGAGRGIDDERYYHSSIMTDSFVIHSCAHAFIRSLARSFFHYSLGVLIGVVLLAFCCRRRRRRRRWTA